MDKIQKSSFKQRDVSCIAYGEFALNVRDLKQNSVQCRPTGAGYNVQRPGPTSRGLHRTEMGSTQVLLKPLLL
jgi:hypothetical protein